MCGIAGIVYLHDRRPVDRRVLERMNETQHHRGPDAGGMHLEPGVGLAHRRLSIIDLTGGQQPMYNEDGTVVVVFNGEIYNYEDLIAELTRAGHVFKTRSDTEVIVHAWEEWGENCVTRFRGMFAFAIWDRNRETLFLARDRLGVKPLHYALLPDGTALFGSELKCLLSNSALPQDLDPRAVEEYFALGYVAEPRTIFRCAKKLEAGHMLSLSRGERTCNPQPYWDVRFTGANVLSLRDACVELEARLEQAIRLRMNADVPLGAFLSGGVDSSSVVATMAEVAELPVTTCSITFTDPAYDEATFARRVARLYQTTHHEHTVDSDDFALVGELAQIFDEPYADSSAIPMFRLCQLARLHVTVALSGDGGDENFAGYRRYRMHLIEERLRARLPLSLRAPIFTFLGDAYPKLDWAPRVLRAKTTLQSIARDSVSAYFESVSIVRNDIRARLFSPRFRRVIDGYNAEDVFRRYAARGETNDPLSIVQYLDLKTYLVNDINTKVDRSSMAHSLEVREPLLDHELVEWLASLPSDLKIRRNEGKFLLKKAMEKKLPNDVLYRPKKGFSVPLARWLRGPLRSLVREALLDESVADSGFFDIAYVRKALDQHESGMRDHSALLWALLMFAAFLQKPNYAFAKGRQVEAIL